ncbi:DUF6712 family protein [Hymenobacter crusticola]|uniref:Uncharacterized protein n=1 Tax=Hymenobacter crusticola TaxID=1770526 RepID=A0A243W5I2_9BACT|nr:DUF6712 family protein [Hymenobacter crusticola]OUJ68666.1 hypothetical protein BXP70_27650 [Hymenobacter crusticola]
MLLQTTQELNKYVTLNSNLTELPKPLATELARLESQLLRPILGDELLAWLREQNKTIPNLADEDSLAGELLRLVQAPLARIGTGSVLDELQVFIDDTGIHIVSTQTDKTAFNWQVSRLERTLQRKGYLDLNVLLQWLEDNYKSSEELQAWATSYAGQRHRYLLITSAPEFSQYVDIQDSWKVFDALRPVLRVQSSFMLTPVLGVEFLQELSEQVRTRTVTPENEHLLHTYVRPLLAHLTLAHAVPALGLRLTGDGIELRIARIDEDNTKEADAGLDQLLAARARDAEQTARVYLLQLRQHLNEQASAEKYATYFASSAYANPATPRNPVNREGARTYKFI